MGPAGFVLVGAGFVADVLMHLVSGTSEVGLTLEALGLVLFFFGAIRITLDVTDYLLPGKVRASNIFWDLILIVLYAVVLMVVLRATLRVDLTSLLATSAVISVIIGFALQETLGNIFAGLAMQMQKPFEPGDWIHFGSHLGRVHGIGWRATRIVTRGNERLEIPNNLIAKDIVVNYTTGGSVADEIFIGLPYEQPPNRVKEVLVQVSASCAWRGRSSRARSIRGGVRRFRNQVPPAILADRLWSARARQGHYHQQRLVRAAPPVDRYPLSHQHRISPSGARR